MPQLGSVKEKRGILMVMEKVKESTKVLMVETLGIWLPQKEVDSQQVQELGELG